MNTQTIETTVPDYVLAKQELEAYFTDLNLLVQRNGGRLSKDDSGWMHNAWVFDFQKSLRPSDVVVKIDYKTGTGIKTRPTGCEVLASAARDGLSTAGTSFEDWASELGYEVDSRKAEAIYRECQGLHAKLRALLTREQISKLADLSSRL